MSPFRVGNWVAEPRWNRIRRGNEIVKLEPRVMKLLQALASVPGEPVSRHELLDRVWHGTFVNEEALSRAVSTLRKALGDDPRSPTYIQTVQKGGYCLLAVERSDCSAGKDTGPRRVRDTSSGHRFAMPTFIGLVLLAALAVLYLAAPSPQEAPASLMPLTSDPGREIDPAISPDGRRVAYLARTGEAYDLFIRSVEGGSATRLTSDPSAKGHLAWSPDGKQLAFIGATAGKTSIFIIPSDGGPSSKLYDLASWSFGLDWSPDGRALAYSDAAPGEEPSIALFDIRSKTVRPVDNGKISGSDVKPVFSPDGKRLAFIRTEHRDRQQIVVVDVDGSKPSSIVAGEHELRGIDWSSDGSEIIFSSRSGGRFQLWRARADASGTVRRIATDGRGDLFNPSTSRNDRIVVENVQQDRDVWQADLHTGKVAPLIRSTFDDYDPAFSPDGRRIAFVSERSGSPEIWVQQSRGDVARLTSLGGAQISRLSWTHDGSAIAFTAERDGVGRVYVQSLDHGQSARMIGNIAERLPIGWSADATILFQLAPTPGGWTLERLIRATGKAFPIRTAPFRLAAVAPDGGSIFLLAADGTKLLRIATDGRSEQQFRLPSNLTGLVELLPAHGSVYLVQSLPGMAKAYRLSLASGSITQATSVALSGAGSISVIPDGSRLAYTRTAETANDLAWMRL